MSKTVNRPSGSSRKKEQVDRIPVSGNRNIMTVLDQDPAFVYRWVNDVDDRIELFKRGGWELVDDTHRIGDRKVDSTKGVDKVISKYVGANRTAYLMRIDRVFYEEDQAAKEVAIREKEATMLQDDRTAEGRYGSLTVK